MNLNETKVKLLAGLRNLKLRIRRTAKLWGSVFLLSPLYWLCCLQPVEENLVVLADGHQSKMPYSMFALSRELKKYPDLKVVEYFYDYSFCGMLKSLTVMMRFMPLYARAKYVFISDCYVPVSCCKKRKETVVVQLWHSCGLMKQVGADSEVEKKSMSPWQYRNYDVFTTSAACVSDTLSGAMGIPRQVFSEAGVSRMDILFSESWKQQIRESFYKDYPEYRGKKIILWAPTFRGSAQTGYVAGEEEILRLQKELPANYALIVKTHRFARNKDLDSVVTYAAEYLQILADVLITDYSSIYFDYLYFRRPVVLFAPDLEAYLSTVGLYRPYETIPGKLVQDYDRLREAVLTTDSWADEDYIARMDRLWDEQMAYCDGRSTEKLLTQIGLLPRKTATN